MTRQKESVLIVAAHPDDEVLGCGATTAKHVAAGDDVATLILAEGVLARREVAHRKDLLDELWADARKANNILGVSDLVINDYPDNKMNAIPMLDIVHRIEAEVERVKPTIVYTHHLADPNIDHSTIAKAMQAVCRPIADRSIARVYAFEIPSSTEWNFSGNRFHPTVFVDVTDTLNKKIEALQAYASEIRDFPHPRSSEYLVALATVRGGQSGYQRAEAFELVYQKISTI
jgi:N-acetylglucosamine malate deacetylase 1